MEIELFYGKGLLKADIPDTNVSAVYRKTKMTPVEDERQAVLDSLASPISSKPLKEIAQPNDTACIVINDITRPVPNKLLLPPIIDELTEAGVKKEVLSRTRFKTSPIRPAAVDGVLYVPTQKRLIAYPGTTTAGLDAAPASGE